MLMQQLNQYPIIHEQKVAWGDMDAFGHVNNVIYYRYIESARIHYFEQLNILNKEFNTVVASNQCSYIKPVFYPDTLKIGVRIDELRNSAFRMHYSLYSVQQNQIVANAEAVVVCVDKVEMKKILMPQNLRDRIIEIEKTVGRDLI